jgi:hypothetical protein
MKVFRILFISIIVILFSAGCQMDSCFKKAGDIVEREIQYDTFGVVHIEGVFNVELVQDTAYYVEAVAPEQVMRGIDFELYKDTLTCYNYNNCFWRRDFDRPQIRIHFSDIRELNVFEASNIYSTDSITDSFNFTVRSSISEADITFNCESVYFYINKTCGGKYIFRGKTKNAYLMNFNAGLFEMEELECKTATVLNYSTIDMSVNVVDLLHVGIYNSGNIRYRGQPEIIIDSISSSGRAISIK